MNLSDVVEPRRFRSFCFRGEGRANFVISAKCEETGYRIVWRLAKQRKSGVITVKPKCQIVIAYLEKLVVPILGRQYLVKPRVVHISAETLHHIAKVPSLPLNMKIETYDELCDTDKFPPSMSFFPISGLPTNMRYVCALQMSDATRIPKLLPQHCFGPTITVEIKPKQGFFQKHDGVNISYCNNCILQYEKCYSEAFEQMYDFCPLDLFSGELERMQKAINSLINVPHRNLRIFLDGTVIHSDEMPLEIGQLEDTLFGGVSVSVSQLVTALCCVLAGCSTDEDFTFRNSSVLGKILAAQRFDTIGIVRAHEIYSSLSGTDQKELLDKCLLPRKGLSFLHKSNHRSLLERYLFAATMKDCSLMISFRLLDPLALANSRGRSSSQQIVNVTAPVFDSIKQQSVTSYLPASFAYSIKIVDLDPKSPKNLLNGYERFMRGVKLVQTSKNLRRPCVM